MLRNNMYDAPPCKPKPAKLGVSGTDLSKKQERRVAKRVSGKRVPASGAIPGMKGDVSSRLSLVECKTTGKKSIRIERDWLVKISREAALQSKYPSLAVSFEGVASDVDADWVLVPMKFLASLIVGTTLE